MVFLILMVVNFCVRKTKNDGRRFVDLGSQIPKAEQ